MGHLKKALNAPYLLIIVDKLFLPDNSDLGFEGRILELYFFFSL